MSRAPIALFVYNRPIHTRRTIEALRGNVGADESALFVFSDGARDQAAAPGVAEVRQLLHGITGFREVHIVEREANLGLAASIVDGVTQLCERYGRVIVVEDDLVTSRWFLKYLNDGLDLYAGEDRVASIHGYRPPVGEVSDGTFFLFGADCWGWATWARAWSGFEPDAADLLRRLKVDPNRRYFDYLGPWPFSTMLKGFLAGRNNSWAVRWHASAFLAGRLTLHPGRSLVDNIGMDGSGTHCGDENDTLGPLIDAPLELQREVPEHSRHQWQLYRRYYVGQLIRQVIRRVFRRKRRLTRR